MFGHREKGLNIMIRNSDQYIPGVVFVTQNKINEVFALSTPSGKRQRSEWRGNIDSEDFPGVVSSQIHILHRKGDYTVECDVFDKERDPKIQQSVTYTLSPITIRYTDHLTEEQFFLTANDPRITELNGIIARVKKHLESSGPKKG